MCTALGVTNQPPARVGGAQKFELLLDTGSWTTFVTCSGCTRCGNRTNGAFDPARSRTSAPVGCGGADCGAPGFSCANGAKGQQCNYEEVFKDGGSSAGRMVRDRE
jgi:hypothetical protein